jgi:hypothetical protein
VLDGERRTYGTIVVCGGGCYGGYYVRQLARARAAGALQFDRVLVVDRDPSCPVSRLAVAIDRADREAITQHRWRVARDADDTTAMADIEAYLALPLTTAIEPWGVFFAQWFASAVASPHTAASDAVVPSPLMPNLLADWVGSRLQALRPSATLTRTPVGAAPETPWQRQGDDGSHYASFATWMCPINCIEPARCPETRGPRTWSMPAAVHQATSAAAEAGRGPDLVALFQTTHRAYGVGMFDAQVAVDVERGIASLATAPALRVLVASVSHCHGALAELVSA